MTASQRQTVRAAGVLLAAQILCAPCAAAPLTPETVSARARNWVRSFAPDALPRATVAEVVPFRHEGETRAYTVHLEGGGFCVCGADDVQKPVYLYSPRGTFEAGAEVYRGFLLKAARDHVRWQQRLRSPTDEQRAEAQRRAAVWQALVDPRTARQALRSAPPTEANATPSSMALPLTSEWHQGRGGPPSDARTASFNGMCPVLTPASYGDPHWTNDEHTIVGCPATSIGQVMYYWHWPDSGTGSGSTTYSYRHWHDTNSYSAMAVGVDPAQCILTDSYPWGGRLEWTNNTLIMKGYWDESLLNSAKTIYNDDGAWSEADITAFTNALQVLYNGAPVTEDDMYGANFSSASYDWPLMADAWGTNLSPASMNAMRLLCYHAGVAIEVDYGVKATGKPIEYDCDAMKDHFRFSNDAMVVNPADESVLREEIQWMRPAVFRGTGAAGGHHWVIYGYDTGADLYLMNMGWSTAANAALWADLDGDADFDFTERQALIAYLAPDNTRFVGANSLGDGSPDDPYRDLEEALAEAPDHAILIFKAGSVNESTADPIVINRPLTLRGYNATVRKQ